MPEASLAITADNSQFLKALKESQEALAAAFEKMQGTVEGLVGAFEKVQRAVTSITSLLAGGAAFKEIIESTARWGEGNIALSKALGISAEEASKYQAALQHLGIGNDVVVAAADKLSKQLYTNSAAFEKAGIATKESNGQFRSVGDILRDVTKYLTSIHDPIERNIAGQQLFGKGWAEVRSILKLSNEELERAAVRVKELGLDSGAEQTHEYALAMRDVGLVITALQNELGKELLPTLTEIGVAFSEGGPQAVAVFGTVLKGIAFGAGTVAIEFQKMGLWLGKLAAQSAAFVHGDFDAIGAIGKDFDSDLQRLNKSADELWDKLNRPPPPVTNESEPPPGPHDFDTKEKSASRVGDWQTALEQQKAADQEDAARHGQLLEDGKQMEIAYWQKILDTTRVSEEEKKQIKAKMAADELAIDKAALEGNLAALKADESAHGSNLAARLAAEEKYAAAVKGVYGATSKEYAEAEKAITATHEAQLKQQEQLDQMKIEAARTVAGQEIDAAEAEAKRKYDINMISLSQLIAAERTAQAQRYALHQEALVQDMALLQQNPNYDPVKMAQIQQQILAAAAQHNQAMLKIDQQANQQEIALQKQLQSTMTQGFTTAFESIIKGTATVHQAFTKMLDTVLNAVVSSIAKMIAQWITAAAVHLLLNRKETLANAGTAASGAMASAAAIPYVGWILAPIEGAAVYAAALGFSARGGYDIPSGINPTGQLHEREMVLPAPIADTIRALAANGGGRGGAGGGFHLHTSNVDSRSLEKALTRKGSLQKALKNLHRRMSR